MATVKCLCAAISMPQSHVKERRRVTGKRRTCGIRAFTTLAVSFPATLTKRVKRDCRSTSVAMWVLFDPVIKSPSQCPGTARSFTSAGRSHMKTPSIIYTPPWLSLRRNALGPPYPPPRQMPCQFFLEDATGLNEQAPIDSFVGHLHLLIIWKRPPQPAGDLFGRPLQTQFISNGPL